MSLTENVQKLIHTSSTIVQYQNTKNIGYFLIPFFIGIVIVYIANKRIREFTGQRNDLVKTIENEIQEIVSGIRETYNIIRASGTYLIYSQKTDFIEKCDTYEKTINTLNAERQYFSQTSQHVFDTTSDQIRSCKQNILDYNENFVKKRMKEYESLFQKSPFPLDNDQRRAVIVDDKHNLVIAGAGSGKTETLITRIAYLVLRKPDTILPGRILALAYQNKAAQEIRNRLKERFGVDVKVKTFHSLGWEILQKAYDKPPQMRFSGDNFEREYLEFIARTFDEVKKTPDFRKDILRYIIFFGEVEPIRNETDFSKKAEFFQYMSNLSYTALNGVKVKSWAERAIYNFLLTHTINGKAIGVKYESPATWIKYLDKHGKEKNPRPDFLLTDFDIYIEHWAIDKSGNVPSWFSGIAASKKYTDHMNKKRSHFLGQTIYSLLETYHWEFTEPLFLEKFQNRLISVLKKKYPSREFVIEEIYSDALIEKVWDENKEFIDALPKNAAQFIQIAKTYHLTSADVRNRLRQEQWTGRQRAFAIIAVRLYERYEADLRSKNCIDFADMINLAIDELHKQDNLYKNVFDHILIDEYQDISTQRSDLIKTLLDKNDGCKLFCVGDDWQSIMGFTGSNLDLFVNFGNFFDHPARTDLTVNYRSSKSIVDLGAAIIRQNEDAQIKKVTLANNPETRQITVFASTFGSYNSKKYYDQIISHCLTQIEQYLKQGYHPEDILILARILTPIVHWSNFLGYARARGIPISTELKNPNKIHLMSVHKSKGLQARVVFILDVVKGLYGFPCEIENPDIYELAINGPKRPREEEERRIFYVAATRAKEDLIIYSQKNAMSDFLGEIKEHIVVEDI